MSTHLSPSEERNLMYDFVIKIHRGGWEEEKNGVFMQHIRSRRNAIKKLLLSAGVKKVTSDEIDYIWAAVNEVVIKSQSPESSQSAPYGHT